MSTNEVSPSLTLIASSSAGNKKETWKFHEEGEGAENQGKAWVLLSADGTRQFCPVLNNSHESGQRFIEPSVLSLVFMEKVQEMGK